MNLISKNEIESSINRLLSLNTNELFKEEISLLSKLYINYYCNVDFFKSSSSNRVEELEDLLNLILIQSINNLNEKLNIKSAPRLLFKSNTLRHQEKRDGLMCNQLLTLHDFNVEKYLDNLKCKYSNKIQVFVTNDDKKDGFDYEIEQYKVEDDTKLYLDKQTTRLKSFIFTDFNSEYEYMFHLIVYKRLEKSLRIPCKFASFRLASHETFQKFHLTLFDQLDKKVANNNEDKIDLNVFKFNNFLDLINNFKVCQTETILKLIMQLIDEKQFENTINSIQANESNSKNDLIIDIYDVKINFNDNFYFCKIKFDHWSNQTNVLMTKKNEMIHLENFNFDKLLQNPPHNFSLSVSVYTYTENNVEKLESQYDYDFNILEYLDSSSFKSIHNEVLSLSLKFTFNCKNNLNINLLKLSIKSIFDSNLIDNCTKIIKKSTSFEQLHLKKALCLVSDLLKLNNQPKKSFISEQLFKLIIVILTTMPNTAVTSALTFTNDNNQAIGKFLIQNLKTQFDLNDLTIVNEAEFTNILRAFHILVELIVKLVANHESSENFKLSLKYDLNYIFLKISKKNYKKKFFIYSFLNFEFISFVYWNKIYSINEIYEVIYFKLFNDLSLTTGVKTNTLEEANVDAEFHSYLKLIEEIIYEKFLNSTNFYSIISENYEFRAQFIKFIVNSFLLASNKVDSTKLKIIFYLMQELHYKFDKKEFKQILKAVLKAFELNYRLCLSLSNPELKFVYSDQTSEQNDFKLFVCLVDLINQSMISPTTIQQLNSYFDNLKLVDFVYMFQLLWFFLNRKINFNLQHVWTHINDVLTQFLTLIFKYILRMIAITTIEATSAETNEHEIELLLISYFKLEFLVCRNHIINDLNQISNCYMSKYRHLNEFLIQHSIRFLLNNEFSNEEFIKLMNCLRSSMCESKILYLMEIFLIYEILENDKIITEKSLISDKNIAELIDLCIDYKQSKKRATLIEKKILTFKLYQTIARIKLTELKDFTDKIYKMKFEIEYKLIKCLIKLNQPNYYEIIVLYKNKLNLLNKCLNNSDTIALRNDEMEKFYYLNLFKYLCLYELSTLSKQQLNQKQDINLIKIPNKSIYSQLFQIYKQVYKFFIKNSSNFKLVEYINLKLNELNLKLNNNDEKFTLVEEKMLFKNTHYYFCIGFFVNSTDDLIKKSLHNRFFLYTSKTNELLTSIQSLILENFGSNINMQILNINQDPLEYVNLSLSTLYVQIFALKKLNKDDLLKILEETLDGDELNENKLKIENENFRYFYYDKPFYKNIENNNIENLWIERTIMYIHHNELFVDFIEYFNEFVEIKCLIKIFLQPIQNAINDCNEKTVELREFINNFTQSAANFTSLSDTEMMSKLQPLTMRLLGCLDGEIFMMVMKKLSLNFFTFIARVNGGIRLYVKNFLSRTFTNEEPSNEIIKKRKYFCYQLYQSIKSQLNVLESGLTIHNRVIKHIVTSNVNAKDDEELNGHSENKENNFEHMNQLNKHLVSCLNLLNSELDEFI